jgi:hypothetical protein
MLGAKAEMQERSVLFNPPGEIASDVLSPGSAFGQSTGNASPVLVMFSGGRDSTLAALRLNLARKPLTLVTVSSSHLIGIDRVHRRLTELSDHLPAQTRWFQVRQPDELRTDTSFFEQTCLPCHHAYVVVSAALATSAEATCLAFGYAGYQADWPEQTPLAVSRLAAVLARYKISLELPVYNVRSRDAAIRELQDFGLSSESLEQKCSRQVHNVVLSESRLRQQVDVWESAIDSSMRAIDTIKIEVLAERTLGAIT